MGLAGGGREGVVLGALFPFDCRTALKRALFFSTLPASRNWSWCRCCSSISPNRAVLLFFPPALAAGCAVGGGCAAGAGGRAPVSDLPVSQVHGGDSDGSSTSEAGLGESGQRAGL